MRNFEVLQDFKKMTNPLSCALLLDGEHTIDALVEEIRNLAEGIPEDVRDHIVAFLLMSR